MIDVHTIEKYKNISVNCSGGADSSIMLFELIQLLEENNMTDKQVHVFTLGHARKGNWNPQVAQGVIRFIVNYFETSVIKKHHIYYAPQPEKEYFHHAQNEIYSQYDIDLQLNATSMAPSENAVITVNGTEYDIAALCPVPQRQTGFPEFTKGNPDAYLPYANYTKDKLQKIYEKNGLLETLFPLTRSCEGFAKDTENYTTTCGECWWCLERYWAFGKF